MNGRYNQEKFLKRKYMAGDRLNDCSVMFYIVAYD